MAVTVAVAALGGSIGDLFDSNGRQLAGASRPRAVPANPLAFPTTLEELRRSGVALYAQFESQDECEEVRREALGRIGGGDGRRPHADASYSRNDRIQSRTSGTSTRCE